MCFQVVKIINSHCHDENPSGVAVEKIRTAVKRRAEHTMERPSQVTFGNLFCKAGLLNS